mmetsp:Transcript_9549/g.23346  ORF Transcript_9549/g.23346 Transcript_9549/m.23346 type:complete len:242 (+) Transcript_9549:2242-2967(+)
MTTAAPLSATLLHTLITVEALWLSRPDVTSSRKTIDGRTTSSTPRLIRRISPPLTPRKWSPPMRLSATLASPSSFRILSVSAATASSVVSLGRRKRAAKIIDSRAVCHASSASRCATKAILRLTSMEAGLISIPSILITPLTLIFPLFVTFPDNTLRRLVFPAPLQPMIAQSSFGLITPRRPFRIWRSPRFLSRTVISTPVHEKLCPRRGAKGSELGSTLFSVLSSSMFKFKFSSSAFILS